MEKKIPLSKLVINYITLRNPLNNCFVEVCIFNKEKDKPMDIYLFKNSELAYNFVQEKILVPLDLDIEVEVQYR